jgi:hypothetical protein
LDLNFFHNIKSRAAERVVVMHQVDQSFLRKIEIIESTNAAPTERSGITEKSF